MVGQNSKRHEKTGLLYWKKVWQILPAPREESTQRHMMNYKYLVILVIFMSLMTARTYGEIYKWVDANGKTHFSNSPQDEEKKQETLTVEVHNEIPDLSLENSDLSSMTFANGRHPYVATGPTPLTREEESYNKYLVQLERQIKQTEKALADRDAENKRLGELYAGYEQWKNDNCKRVQIITRKDDKVRKREEVQCSPKPYKYQEIDNGREKDKLEKLQREYMRASDAQKSTEKSLEYVEKKLKK